MILAVTATFVVPRSGNARTPLGVVVAGQVDCTGSRSSS
jgi:hypothetical protein